MCEDLGSMPSLTAENGGEEGAEEGGEREEDRSGGEQQILILDGDSVTTGISV